MSAILLRAATRFSVRRQVRVPCQIVREGDFRLVADHCTDLSTTGMQAKAVRFASVGETVLVSFCIPNSNVWLDTEGVITRVMWGRRDEDGQPAYGLRFGALPPLEAAVLVARLRGMPPPLPARPLRTDYAATVRRIAVAA